ncbi:4'-phosphopantetheinyl transferase superfamily protein [Streptomyces sp. NPDC006422]|uniref:4'-phosphopantetheinyl transferase family protein n=1 Tax=unclassified Streptomyces TaxID=2593676 RepID=UPI0033A1384C
MIQKILPAACGWSQSFTDGLDIDLFPQEQDVIAGAVAARQAEFTTVRACAREALSALGHAPVPLVPGERGAPTWPEGVVGSMTHCTGYRAAAVARTSEVVALGIDAEPNAALPEEVLPHIALPEDHIALEALPNSTAVAWDRLLFSAKEAVYKAWFPLAGRWLDFRDATVTLTPDGTFTARILVPGPVLLGRPLTGFHGRWAVGDGLLVTTIAVEVGH